MPLYNFLPYAPSVPYKDANTSTLYNNTGLRLALDQSTNSHYSDDSFSKSEPL